MADLSIRAARPAECAQLSDLALRSKGHWGYSAAFLQACQRELTYDESLCASGRLRIGIAGSKLVGFSLVTGSPPRGELQALFLDPDSIGLGFGKALLFDALRHASVQGFEHLVLDADPGAESFYLHLGAKRIGTSASGSIPGRVLPHLEFVLGGT